MQPVNLPDPQVDPTESFVQGEFTPQDLPETPMPAAPPTSLEPQPPTKTRPFKPTDMASLVGLNLPPTTETSALVTSDEDRALDENSKTRLPVYKKSIFQMAVIGACIGGAVILVGSLVLPHEQKEKVAIDPTPVASPAAREDFAPDPKFGVVASKLAMQQQEQDILATAQAQQQQANAARATAAGVPNNSTDASKPTTPANTTPNIPKDDPNPPVIANSNPPSTEPSYHPPAPVTIPAEPIPSKPTPPSPPAVKPVTLKPMPQPVPVQRPVVIVARQAAAVRSQTQTTPPISPSQKTKPTPIDRPSPVSWKVANANAAGVWGSRTVPPVAATTTTAQALPTPPGSPTSSNSVTTGRAIVGQQIKAKLISPIQTSATVPTQEIALSLQRSIISDRGKVLIPAGTQILAQIGILDSGMMSILAAKAIINDREVDIPARALILQASNHQPLLAELKQFGQDEVGRRDWMAMLGGAAQAIGKNLTEPQTSTVATASGIVQSTNPQQNILGAGLNGGFAPVAQQWLDRNQQAIQQINARSKVWYLGTGTEVTLVVAQPFAL